MRASTSHRILANDLQTVPTPPSVKAVLVVIQKWLRGNIKGFGAENRKRFSLDFYVSTNLDDYPTQRSSLDPDHELKMLVNTQYSSFEPLARKISWVFSEGITTQSGVSCPQCGDSDLHVFIDRECEEAVLECEICLWAQKGDSRERNSTALVHSPTVQELRKVETHLD